MDEDKTPAQDAEVPEPSSGEEQPLQDNQAPPAVDETPVDDLPEEQPEEQEQQDVSPREERRAKNLANKFRDAAQERDTYKQQLMQSQQQPEQAPQSTVDDDFRTKYETDRFIDRLERDTEKAARRYSALDETSESYDPGLDADISKLYLQQAGFNERTGELRNPNVSYEEVADSFMGAIEKYANKTNAESAENVAKQASRAGVRPGSSKRNSQVGAIKPGDISKMDPKTYERNKGAIRAQINRELGL